MYQKFQPIEVTKDNELEYLDGIVKLEDTVYENMIKQGKAGQLFTTGREDISEYIHSDNNSVFVMKRTKPPHDVVAATYITQGQIPFTYNDVTKYYKCSEKYMQYVKSQYASEEEYIADLRKAYIKKLTAFIYARDAVLREYCNDIQGLNEDDKNSIFMELVNKEVNNPENNFHEKSKIREYLNKYMSQYMQKNGFTELFEKFYWVGMEYIKSQSKIPVEEQPDIPSKLDSTIQAYDEILRLQKFEIYDRTEGMDEEKYYSANTGNTIELDTYLTSDQEREFGLARIIVFEGIRRVLEKQHLKEKNGPVFLVSTLHRDNLSSKYVSEFFGLKDNVYVKRRVGRNREVHICRIDGGKINEYLEKIQKKLAVLYKYNPNEIELESEEEQRIFEEQLEYEKKELQRLQQLNNSKYDGYIHHKEKKIKRLEQNVERAKSGDKVTIPNAKDEVDFGDK